MRTVCKCFSGAGLGSPWGGTTTPPQGDPGTGNHFWKNTLQSFDVKSLRFDTKKQTESGRTGGLARPSSAWRSHIRRSRMRLTLITIVIKISEVLQKPCILIRVVVHYIHNVKRGEIMISDTKKRVQVTLSRDLIDELEYFTKATGYSKSDFVEVALRQYLRKESNE